VWRALKLETLVWAQMYDDTVRYAPDNAAVVRLAGMVSPKIEPEIVLKLKRPIDAPGLDADAILERTEWVALAFEIIDCPFPDWKFKPADFVAAYGLHRAEAIGAPQPVAVDAIAALAEGLAGFKLQLQRNGATIEEGAGKNALKSPALCVAELGGALLKQGLAPLAAGDLVSTGTLTAPHPIAPGETWKAVVEGLPTPALTLRFV
jgi:2-keto-4-pentenoate hydratase